MPTVKDKLTGDVVSNQPYTAEGTQRAEQIAASDPNWEIDYAPGGKQSAMDRSTTTYAGGGKTGYNVPQYKKGGKTEKPKWWGKAGKDVKDAYLKDKKRGKENLKSKDEKYLDEMDKQAIKRD